MRSLSLCNVVSLRYDELRDGVRLETALVLRAVEPVLPVRVRLLVVFFAALDFNDLLVVPVWPVERAADGVVRFAVDPFVERAERTEPTAVRLELLTRLVVRGEADVLRAEPNDFGVALFLMLVLAAVLLLAFDEVVGFALCEAELLFVLAGVALFKRLVLRA
ncbi:MAG TPA: hypothetical protein VHA52_11500 [Candidatus Babeliaceae bacterium]|nr:hypothetical protein [Candidatus Babeliaceae bacterium]